MTDLWIFAYGSLMWRPGFPFVEARPARISGWHRALCVYSWHHRGTLEAPGVVLGLDRGGSCRGLAYRIAAADRTAVLAYLRERELVSVLEGVDGMIYREVIRPLRLDGGEDGARCEALTYVVDRSHPQYTGALTEDALVALIRDGHGVSGENTDYLRATVDHLRQLGIHDAPLERLYARLDAAAL